MRGKGWIRDIVSHFLILVLLGTGLFYLRKKADEIPALASMEHLDIAFYVAFSLFLLMVIVFFFQLFSSVKLERFSPGNPESLARLDRIRRFRLQKGFKEHRWHWPEYREAITSYFAKDGWESKEDVLFDAVYTRQRKIPRFGKAPLVDQIFLFYHPMLNVIIVDQMLKECEKQIEDNKATLPAPRNRVIFLTDMRNREEVTSAGAGVVNYLCVPSDRTSLYPMLFDYEAARLFYPLDTTMVPRRHRLYFWLKRIVFKSWIRKKRIAS